MKLSKANDVTGNGLMNSFHRLQPINPTVINPTTYVSNAEPGLPFAIYRPIVDFYKYICFY